MKIEETQVTRLKITEVERLDPVTVFLEDFEAGRGKITIECYGKSWSTFWGGMGTRTISEFFCSCDNHYISKNLSPETKCSVTDYDRIPDYLRKHIIYLRREADITKEAARALWDEVKYATIEENAINCGQQQELIDVLGNDWWEFTLPQQPNHEWEYLCRIIDAVKAGIKEHTDG